MNVFVWDHLCPVKDKTPKVNIKNKEHPKYLIQA